MREIIMPDTPAHNVKRFNQLIPTHPFHNFLSLKNPTILLPPNRHLTYRPILYRLSFCGIKQHISANKTDKMLLHRYLYLAHRFVCLPRECVVSKE